MNPTRAQGPGAGPATLTAAQAFSDARVMAGRSLRRSVRDGEALLMAVVLPVSLMLLFVFVFGNSNDVGAGDYVDYVVPGIVLLCAGFGAASTATYVAADARDGIVDRFRSLPVLGSAHLIGHVVASIARNLLATALVVGVALLIGWSPVAGALEWLAVLGVLVLFMAAVSFLAAALGMLVDSVEAANAITFAILFLPYLSSAFVRPETMPGALRAVAEHQPFTPTTDTLRGLLMGAPIGNQWWITLIWWSGILAMAVLAASALARRQRR